MNEHRVVWGREIGPVKAICACLIVAFASIAVNGAEPSRLAAQSAPKEETLSFDGTWEGKTNDLPSIELKIANSKGRVSGTITFFFQQRSNENEPWHVVGGSPGPLIEPRVDGKILTFEVEHHKCHGCAEFGPNVKFRVELKEANEARLWKLEDEGAGKDKDLGPGLKMVRKDESAPPEPAKSPRLSYK